MQAFDFYPRSPCGERRGRRVGLPVAGHFYPRSPCGERLNSAYGALEGASISIHALLAESDGQSSGAGIGKQIISIHALLAESDYDTSAIMKCQVKFLSTLSLRRATCLRCCAISCITISIHALLAESDGGSGVGSWRLVIFLSTLSLRRATA